MTAAMRLHAAGRGIMGNFFGLFELIIGVYLIYGAITGKGQLYRNEHVKKGQEALYKKRVRQISAVLGPIMLAEGVIDYILHAQEAGGALRVLSLVLWGLALTGIGVLFVVSLRLTDRSKTGSQAKQTQQRPAAPRSAFEFDDEDEPDKTKE